VSRQHGTALGPGSPVLALDIGASSVKYAVFDDDGGIAHSGVRELVLDRQEAALEQLAGHDPNDDVREAAAEAAEKIRGR